MPGARSCTVCARRRGARTSRSRGCDRCSLAIAIHEMKLITLKAGMMPTDLKSFGKAPLRPVPSKDLGRKRPGRRRAPPEPRHQRRGGLRMVRSHPQRAGAPEAYLPGLLLRSMRPPSAREDREAGGLLEAPPPLVRRELHARRGPEQLRHQAQRYGGLPRRDLPQREDSRRRALHAAEVHRQNAAHRPLPGPSPGDGMVRPSSRASDHAPGQQPGSWRSRSSSSSHSQSTTAS